eukprot:Sspe_Gene.13910::Locus_4794_Transcript_1_1_Confidence_1.000_Length_1520::g.13910::m.13910
MSTLPKCKCGHSLIYSSYLERRATSSWGVGGWSCSLCEGSGKGERWVCRKCQVSQCYKCRGPDGELRHHGRPLALDDGTSLPTSQRHCPYCTPPASPDTYAKAVAARHEPGARGGYSGWSGAPPMRDEDTASRRLDITAATNGKYGHNERRVTEEKRTERSQERDGIGEEVAAKHRSGGRAEENASREEERKKERGQRESEEMRRKDEEEMKRREEEEDKRKDEEERRKEEERRREEGERRHREEMKQREEEETKRREEEERRQREQEEKRRKAEEERQRKEEESQREAEKQQKEEEERRCKEAEEKRQKEEEEKRQREEEKQREEEERRQREEEKKQKEEE